MNGFLILVTLLVVIIIVILSRVRLRRTRIRKKKYKDYESSDSYEDESNYDSDDDYTNYRSIKKRNPNQRDRRHGNHCDSRPESCSCHDHKREHHRCRNFPKCNCPQCPDCNCPQCPEIPPCPQCPEIPPCPQCPDCNCPDPCNGGSNEKVVICHFPPGNPENAETIEVTVASLPAHYGHGDTLGPCPEEPGSPDFQFIPKNKAYANKKKE